MEPRELAGGGYPDVVLTYRLPDYPETVLIRNEQWRPRRRIEKNFQEDISVLLRRSLTQGGEERVRLMSTPEFIQRWSWQAAQRMVLGLFQESARNWRAAARESMQGHKVYRALESELNGPVGERMRTLISANAQLIRSLPPSVASLVSAKAAEHAVAGERAAGFSREELLTRVSRSRAMMIARTEVSKASTALTRARSAEMGLDWYIWETSDDERVRQAHKIMQGVLVSFSEPPAPELLVGMKSAGHYAAGDIYYCRCYPAPLLSYSQVSWPHKVYYGGRIVMMRLADFRTISRFTAAAAA